MDIEINMIDRKTFVDRGKKNLLCFQTENFEDNFKFDENGRKHSKWVETVVGKREIARHAQFLLFPTMFSKYLRVVSVRHFMSSSNHLPDSGQLAGRV